MVAIWRTTTRQSGDLADGNEAPPPPPIMAEGTAAPVSGYDSDLFAPSTGGFPPKMTAPITVDETSFEGEVLSSEKPVLVDFWAPWCGPCRLVSPVVESLGQKHAEKISVAKVNTDENQQLAMRYSIFSIPTLILFKNGSEAARLVGYMPQEQMEERLKSYL
jgi:thioredoxin 1